MEAAGVTAVEEVYRLIKKSRAELLGGSGVNAVKLTKEALKAVLTAEVQIQEGLERVSLAANDDQILLDEVVNHMREEEPRVAKARQAALECYQMVSAWNA